MIHGASMMHTEAGRALRQHFSLRPSPKMLRTLLLRRSWDRNLRAASERFYHKLCPASPPNMPLHCNKIVYVASACPCGACGISGADGRACPNLGETGITAFCWLILRAPIASTYNAFMSKFEFRNIMRGTVGAACRPENFAKLCFKTRISKHGISEMPRHIGWPYSRSMLLLSLLLWPTLWWRVRTFSPQPVVVLA